MFSLVLIIVYAKSEKTNSTAARMMPITRYARTLSHS